QIDEVISPERSVSPQPGCSTWDLPRTPPRSGGFVQQPEINREIAENNNSQITPGKMLDQISPIPSMEVVKKITKRSRNIAVILNTTDIIQSLKLRKEQDQKTKERKEKSQKLRMKGPLKRRKYESESSDETEGEIHLDDEEEENWEKKRPLTQAELQYFADHLSEVSEDGLETSDNDDDALPQDFDNTSPANDLLDNENDHFDIDKMPMIILPDLSLDSRNVSIKHLYKKQSSVHVSEQSLEGNSESCSALQEDEYLNVLITNIPKHDANKDTSRKRKNEVLRNDEKTRKKESAEDQRRIREVLCKLKWREGNLIMPEESVKFKVSKKLPDVFCNLETPYQFFTYFFYQDLIKLIVVQSNLFSVQLHTGNPVSLQETDVKRYIGICVLMSVIHMPNIRSYWSSIIGTDIIKNTMSQKQFEKIKKHLHFNDNSKMLPKGHELRDRLHKIRPLVDEQMCPTKTKSYLKQYMPAKPHKWGFKVYVLAGVSGYCYNFEIYSGQENTIGLNESDLGACANIVTRLLRNPPNDMNYHVYFDNYYTLLGTIRSNRIPKCPLPGDKEMSKENRGTSKEYITETEGVPISSIAWKNNTIVSLVSTFCRTLPKSKADRYDKSQNIDCPKILKEYNKHMGGVDLMDSLIGRYRIKLKSRKWYFRLFYHLLDMTIVNAWLLYRRVNAQNRNTKTLGLSNFIIELGEILCKISIR
ncbi:unnamed protein product, partial [Acanthoscelides obtectus]